MIRENRKLPPDAIKGIPLLVEEISQDQDVVTLFVFGSAALGDLKPLSDLDFAVLLSFHLSKKERFRKHLDLIGIFTETFRTDEIDLVIMNDAPVRFSHRVFKEGRLLHCRDEKTLGDFYERILREYLDFRFYREEFDRIFLEKVGYYG